MADITREALEQASKEHIEFIIEEIKTRLQVVNTAAINPKSFDTDNYEDLLDLYDFIIKRERFTMNEIESIISELGQIRKR